MVRHLPVLIQTAVQLRKEFPDLRCVLFRPEEVKPAFYLPYLKAESWIELTSDPQYELRKRLWLAIGVSGTASLENMLLGVPMVIMYKLSPLSYWIARLLVRIRSIGIPNVLAQRQVVPEFIQDAATSDALVTASQPLLRDAKIRQAIKETLLSLRTTLQNGGSAKAADEILKLIA